MARARRQRTIDSSCSGSSNVAQLANSLAVRLDRAGVAEMSCIAGVGGGVRSLVRQATSSASVIAIDGCRLACCERVLAARGVPPARLVRLHERGLRKVKHADFSAAEVRSVYADVLAELAPHLLDQNPEPGPIVARELGRSTPQAKEEAA